MRRFLAASVACGVVISATTIASAVVLAHIVAGVITDPGTRTVAHWAAPLWILLTLWVIRTLAHWLQGRLSQRGATAVIADLAGECCAPSPRCHRANSPRSAIPPPR